MANGESVNKEAYTTTTTTGAAVSEKIIRTGILEYKEVT